MMIKDQDILGTEEDVKKFLLMVPDEQMRTKLEAAMLKFYCSKDRWEVFEEMVTAKSKKVATKLIIFTKKKKIGVKPEFQFSAAAIASRRGSDDPADLSMIGY